MHIKLMGMKLEHHASKYSALLHTLDPWMGSKGKNFFFAEEGHIAFQITRNIMHGKMYDLLHTPGFLGWAKDQTLKLC